MFITPHVQRKRGEVIGVGAHIYVYMFVDQSYFSDRLTFSNICGRISRRIYSLLPRAYIYTRINFPRTATSVYIRSSKRYLIS